MINNVEREEILKEEYMNMVSDLTDDWSDTLNRIQEILGNKVPGGHYADENMYEEDEEDAE